MNPYWTRKAKPWVSVAVLAGGLVSACLIFFIYEVERDFEVANASLEKVLILERKD